MAAPSPAAEKQTIDALRSLVRYSRTLREERKAIVTIKPKTQEEIIKRVRLIEEAGAVAFAVDIDSAGRAARALPARPGGHNGLVRVRAETADVDLHRADCGLAARSAHRRVPFQSPDDHQRGQRRVRRQRHAPDHLLRQPRPRTPRLPPMAHHPGGHLTPRNKEDNHGLRGSQGGRGVRDTCGIRSQADDPVRSRSNGALSAVC